MNKVAARDNRLPFERGWREGLVDYYNSILTYIMILSFNVCALALILFYISERFAGTIVFVITGGALILSVVVQVGGYLVKLDRDRGASARRSSTIAPLEHPSGFISNPATNFALHCILRAQEGTLDKNMIDDRLLAEKRDIESRLKDAEVEMVVAGMQREGLPQGSLPQEELTGRAIGSDKEADFEVNLTEDSNRLSIIKRLVWIRLTLNQMVRNESLARDEADKRWIALLLQIASVLPTSTAMDEIYWFMWYAMNPATSHAAESGLVTGEVPTP
jgi:hypothetical protein